MKTQKVEKWPAAAACLGALLFLICPTGIGAADLDPVLVGQYPPYGEGYVQAIVIADHHAYVAFGGAGLQILDLRDSSKPQLVGTYDPAADVLDVVVQGGYAYISMDAHSLSGFEVLDVSDPTHPRKLGRYTSPWESCSHDDKGVSVLGNFACLWSQEHRLEVVNISDPTQPRLTSTFEVVGAASVGRPTLLSNSVLFPTRFRSETTIAFRLEIVDLSDPVQPRALGTCDLLTDPYGGSVVVSGPYAYVGGLGLTVVDLSDPAHPAAVGAVDEIAPGSGSQIAVSAQWVVMGGEALTVWDVSNPANPRRAGQLALPGQLLAVSGSTACFGDRYGHNVQVVDLPAPDAPRLAGVYAYPAAGIVSVTVTDDYAYIASGGALQAINIINRAAPFHVGEYRTDGYINRVRISGGLALVLSHWWNETNHQEGSRYEIVDVSNPVLPRRAGAAAVGDGLQYWTDFEISGDYAYLAGSWSEGTKQLNGLRVLALTNIAQPTQVGACLTAWSPGGLALAGRYVCMVSSRWVQNPLRDPAFLQVVDISDATRPRPVGECAFSGPAGGIAASGHYLYVGAKSGLANAELQVIDVSNPATPQPMARCPLEGGEYPTCWEISVSGGYACLAMEYGGVLVFDISEPALPRRVGRWSTRAQTMGVTAAGRYAYAADSAFEVSMNRRSPEGLVILDLDNPACLQRLGSVDLPTSGSETTRIADGLAAAGHHTYVTSTGTVCANGCGPSTNLLEVIDTLDPRRPLRSGQLDLGQTGIGGQRYIDAASPYAFMSFGGTAQVIDCHDPAHPRKVGEVESGGATVAVSVLGGHAYVVGCRGRWEPGETERIRFLVFDAMDLPNLRQVSLIEFPGQARGLAVSGQYAYLSGQNLDVINISQPASPQHVGSCQGLGGGLDGQVATSASRVCVVGDGLLRVFDVSEEASPRIVGECAARGVDIALEGNCAYVAGGGRGVEVFDLSDPARPRRIGGNSAFDAYALAVADGRLHVAAGEQGLVILNLYEPPRLESLRLGPDGFHLLLRGVTTQTLRLERSRNLQTWEPFATVPIPVSGQALIDPAAITEPWLFYRAVSQP